MRIREFWLAKYGNAIEEYEDAFHSIIGERRFAIADGASESCFAKRWAQSLVHKFTISSPALPLLSINELLEWLKPLQDDWYDSIDWKHLSWNAEAKALEGAFSSLLGLVFNDNCEYWQTFAIGDSCLFHVRNDELLNTFPIESAAQFGNRPLLLSSNPDRNQNVWEFMKYDHGDCQYGDLFFLSTDALSHWFISQHEVGMKPWTTLCNLNTEEEFSSFVTQLRKECLMRNDDVTLFIISLDSNNS